MLADTRKAVPFDPAGAGFCIYFSTADLAKLGERFERRDGLWFEEIERRLRRGDAATIQDTLRLGLKGPNGARPARGAIDFSDLPFAPGEAAVPIADALTCALSGVPYARLVAAREAAPIAAAAA